VKEQHTNRPLPKFGYVCFHEAVSCILYFNWALLHAFLHARWHNTLLTASSLEWPAL